MQHVSIQLVATPVFYLIPVLPMLSARLFIILQSVLVLQATWETHKLSANYHHLCQYLWVVNQMMNVLWTRLVITHVVLIPAIVGLIASVMSSTTNPCAMLQQDFLETPKLNDKNVSDKEKISQF
jgi:hypothetical protein